MNDRRGTARRRVCLGGMIETAAFLPALNCTIRNVSLDGALIRIDVAAILPACVRLHVPQRGECRAARIVWREGDAAGLRFEEGAAGDVIRQSGAAADAENERLRAALLARPGGSMH